jgi:hypothetical protein
MNGNTGMYSISIRGNRAKDAFTDADWAYLKKLIKDNQNSFNFIRLYYLNYNNESYYGN